MAGLIYDVLNGIFSFVLFVLLASAVMSWLIYFNVLNTRNPTVWRLTDILDRITAPILAPFRMFIPPMGGLDLSFLVAVLVIGAIQNRLLPLVYTNLYQLLGS
jgi:YggT family protein